MKSFLLLPLVVCFAMSTFSQNRYDVVIDEIMADPTPQVGLPNNEWIELKNTSSIPINLQNWRIGDATSQSGPMPNFTLQPDSFVVVCTGSAVAALSAFGTTISVTSFPSLDNAGDQLFLKAANGSIIHAVSYSDSWYQNAVKASGGWTLEMIDTKSPCAGSDNWKASIDPGGGTPGRKNSVDAVNTDQAPPSLLRTYTLDSITIIIVFDEPVDSSLGATVSNYTIDGGLSIANATTLSPLFDKVQLKLNSKMSVQTVYTIKATNISDCKGNLIGSNNHVKAGLPEDAAPFDMVVNEILFNPQSNGYDYVEFYNRRNKIFDASKMYVANRNSSNAISSVTALSSLPYLIFPGDYIVSTQNSLNLQGNYLVKVPENVLEVSSLPSFPDDKGFVVLLNAQGAVADEVDYNHSWHFKLLDNEDGVALERIDPDGTSQDPNNWHSAASTAGYGTPTYKNSQYKQPPGINATIEITPKVFSPDNDGRDDIAIIQYKVADPGFAANITIFDAAGRPVRSLVQNAILGASGYWNWDGLDDKGRKLPVGTYVIFTEMFNLQGKKEKFKNTVVLARKLN
ncbi:MAG: lamin tail domain-containing protein [Bacteroidetes bacterium]|nr:lamin tail domain-containing protein [Bacteroidota bacterium]MBS1930903.1 lamin tail domain-containing protein [Bacteroidota bacterium]